MKELKNKSGITIMVFVVAIIGVIIISTGISVYATYNYFASDITYTKDGKTNTTVSLALDDLYQKISNYPMGNKRCYYESVAPTKTTYRYECGFQPSVILVDYYELGVFWMLINGNEYGGWLNGENKIQFESGVMSTDSSGFTLGNAEHPMTNCKIRIYAIE